MSIAHAGAAAALTAVLVAGGAAVAGTTEDSVTEATAAAATETTYTVEDAGTVTVLRSEGALQITQVAPAPGWDVEVESFRGVDVEAVFSSASAELRFEAEIEDGAVSAMVRVSAEVTSDPTTVPAPASAAPDESGDDSEDDEESEDGDRGREKGLPDHVDLSSRPASLRASETAFEHAGGTGEPPVGAFDVPGVGPVTLGVTADGSLTVDAPGWDDEVDTHGDGRVDIELTRGDTEIELRIEGDGSFRVREDD